MMITMQNLIYNLFHPRQKIRNLNRILLICLLCLFLITILRSDQGSVSTLQASAPSDPSLPRFDIGLDLSSNSEWIGPPGGAITDLDYDPHNPKTVYAATNGGGLYRSIDGGNSWQNRNNGLRNLFLTTVEVAPSNPSVLFVGTYQGGVYKSTDQGKTWLNVGGDIQPKAITYAIEVDPGDEDRVYLASRGNSNYGQAPWSGILYKSTNGGLDWTPSLSNVGGEEQQDWAYDLAIHPLQTNVIYAATHEHGAYRSTDFGNSWSPTNSGITSDKGLTSRTIEPDPTSTYPGAVYMGVFERTGLFKSLNGGSSWDLLNQGLTDVRLYKLNIDPWDSETLYLATFDDGVMKSTNAGFDWYSIGLEKEIPLDIVSLPGDPAILLSGTIDNGLWQSADNGENWIRSQVGLHASSVSSLSIQAGDSNTLYAALSPGLIQRSSDGGATWHDFQEGIPDRTINKFVAHPTENLVLYALTDSGGMFMRHTTDNAQWVPVGENLPSASKYAAHSIFTETLHWSLWEDYLPGVYNQQLESKAIQAQASLLSLVFDPIDSNIAYLGIENRGVYKSYDYGSSWTPSGLKGLTVRALKLSPDDPNTIYACTNDSGSVYQSTDGAETWTNLDLPSGTAFDLAVSPSNPNILFVATDVGIYKYDGDWTFSSQSEQVLTSIIAHPSEAGQLYAGSSSGAYYSVDGGVTWHPGPAELEGVWIRSIQIDPNNPDIIYFATKNHGVLRLSP